MNNTIKLQLIVLAIICALIVGTLAVRKNKEREVFDTTTEQPNTQNDSLATDADRDGLADWEEVLAQTNPNDPDSNNNGVPDGIEVRDNGTFSTVIRTAQTNNTNVNYENTGTSQQGQNRVIPSQTTPENPLKTYGNSLASLIKEYRPTFEATLTSLTDNLKQPSIEGKEAIAGLHTSYLELSQRVTTIVAPLETQSLNNAVVEGYKSISSALSDFSKGSGAEISSAVYVGYDKAVSLSASSLLSIAQFFKDKGIAFSASEPGYIFMMPAQ